MAGSSYSWRGRTPEQIASRVGEIFRLFGWRKDPISRRLVDASQQLGYRDSELLRSVPNGGRFSVPYLILTAVSDGQSLAEVGERLRALEVFGVSGPEEDAAYLGISWAGLLES